MLTYQVGSRKTDVPKMGTLDLMTSRCRGPYTAASAAGHLEKNGENSAFETF